MNILFFTIRLDSLENFGSIDWIIHPDIRKDPRLFARRLVDTGWLSKASQLAATFATYLHSFLRQDPHIQYAVE